MESGLEISRGVRFLRTQCGSSSLRACAEARGGRKALKAYIRQLDGDRDSWQDDVKNEMHARMGKLYDLYQACKSRSDRPVRLFQAGTDGSQWPR